MEADDTKVIKRLNMPFGSARGFFIVVA